MFFLWMSHTTYVRRCLRVFFFIPLTIQSDGLDWIGFTFGYGVSNIFEFRATSLKFGEALLLVRCRTNEGFAQKLRSQFKFPL